MSKEKDKCKNPAFARYTWPGRNESTACLLHAQAIANIAKAIGCDLQMFEINQRNHIDEHDDVALCQSADDLPEELK